ncbi:MAG: PQQ-binding-like beta-propeller repeat protein [Candidatus Brocadiaceae bacterium]|nr:PQQ-binding-like beta-propeller repeat protein [Candidatus Brocadiaceae bacterium]
MQAVLNLCLILIFLLLSTVSLASPKDPIWMDSHSGKVTPKGFTQKYKRGQIPKPNKGITPPDNTTSKTSSGTHSTVNGTLLWEDHYNREGDLWDSADGVVVKGNKVFVVGRTETTVGYIAFSVRTYDVRNGALIWENHYDREGDLFDAAWDIAVDGNKVFVVGTTETTAGGPSFSIRAYNANDGVLLWENNYDRESNLRDEALGVAAKGNRVFVVGNTETAIGGLAFSIRAYNAINGTLLWEDHYDREGSLEDGASEVAVSGNKVFVAGWTYTTLGGGAFSVRVYSAINGTLLWKDYYNRETNLDDWAYEGVAVSGDKVFITGLTSTTKGEYAFSVRAYDTTNGTLLWQNDYDSEGNLLDWANSVAIDGKRVFVGGGTGGTAPDGGIA